MIETMKVKPWGEGQGDHVIINTEDFDPKVHVAIEPVPSFEVGSGAPLATPGLDSPKARKRKRAKARK